MQVSATISSIKILKNHVSITFHTTAALDMESTVYLKNKLLRFNLESPAGKAWFKGEIVSAGMRKTTYFVVHTPVHRAVILRLVSMRHGLIVLNFSIPRAKERVGEPGKENLNRKPNNGLVCLGT